MTAPGVYVGTMLPISHDWRDVKPFFLQEPRSSARAAAGLKSELWARDYNEIKAIGGRKGRQRTAEQTEIARFWTATGPAT